MYRFSFFSWARGEVSPGFSFPRPQPLAAARVAADRRAIAIRAVRIRASPLRASGRPSQSGYRITAAGFYAGSGPAMRLSAKRSSRFFWCLPARIRPQARADCVSAPMTRRDQRAAIGRPRQGGLLHSAASRRSHLPPWYQKTSTIEPRAGRTASHRGHRNLYLLMLRFETEFHWTRRAVPQTHLTSVRRIPCFKSLDYTCPSVQVGRGLPARSGTARRGCEVLYREHVGRAERPDPAIRINSRWACPAAAQGAPSAAGAALAFPGTRRDPAPRGARGPAPPGRPAGARAAPGAVARAVR